VGTGGGTAAGGAGAAAGAGGIGAAGVGGVFSGGAGDGGGPAETCVENPPPLHTSGTIVEFPFELAFEDQPFVYGEPNTVAAGTEVIPLNVRFYVTDVKLVTGTGETLRVDSVTEAGVQEPYGIFLFNAEDGASQSLRVRAPAGDYTALAFGLGLTPACNNRAPEGSQFPLSPTSQMTWPFPFGYLFLRYDARLATGTATAMTPLEIHMGGDLANRDLPSAVSIRVVGPINVPATGTARRSIRVAMDQIFKGATTEVDTTGFPLPPEGHLLAGERLRRNAPGLQLFVFEP
jgi:hypothetical protein